MLHTDEYNSVATLISIDTTLPHVQNVRIKSTTKLLPYVENILNLQNSYLKHKWLALDTKNMMKDVPNVLFKSKL